MQTRHRADLHQDMNTLADKVRGVIAAYLDLPMELIVEGASLSNDLGADSLEITEIAMALEEAFSIEISDSAIDDFMTVGDIVRHLQTCPL